MYMVNGDICDMVPHTTMMIPSKNNYDYDSWQLDTQLVPNPILEKSKVTG
jgi:hypothetical protein